MKYLLIALLLTGCVITPVEKRRSRTLDCTKDLIGYDAGALDAYNICKDIYRPKPSVTQEVQP